MPTIDRFTELLCSRLCHDLISPLGAINNGVELLSEGNAGVLGDAIALIGSSSRQATARLAYFRLAFGAWGSEPILDFGTIRKAVEGHFEIKRCPISWAAPTLSDSAAVDKPVGKLVLNLLVIAAECAQRDARIDIALALDKGRPHLSIGVRGERCKLRDDVRTGFAAELEDGGLTVRNVIAHHCRRLCGALALELTVAEEGPNSVEFRAA